MRVLQSTLLNGDRKHEPKETKELGSGDKFPACRCWRSKKFPMCDGSHAAYNKETGDNVGPLVVSVKSGGASS
jgi:CDGSH-type Zn-finger protein